MDCYGLTNCWVLLDLLPLLPCPKGFVSQRCSPHSAPLELSLISISLRPQLTHLCGAHASQVVASQTFSAEIGSRSVNQYGTVQARPIWAVPNIHISVDRGQLFGQWPGYPALLSRSAQTWMTRAGAWKRLLEAESSLGRGPSLGLVY